VGQDEGFYLPACHKPNVVHNAIGQIMITDIVAIPRWTLNLDEVSNGVFQITLTDREGRKAELTDLDSQQNIYKCIGYAFDIERQINKNWNKYLFDTIIFRLGDTKTSLTDYNDKAFGSWTIELINKRIILDGRDGLMTFQSRSDNDWKDEWEKNYKVLTFDELNELIDRVKS
jgi:hypothetical protein